MELKAGKLWQIKDTQNLLQAVKMLEEILIMWMENFMKDILIQMGMKYL